MYQLAQIEPNVDKIPSNIQKFLENFYLLLDGESSQAAKEWSGMFEENGEFIAAGETQKGRKGTQRYSPQVLI